MLQVHPFGLFSACYMFTKLFCPSVCHWRAKDIWVIIGASLSKLVEWWISLYILCIFFVIHYFACKGLHLNIFYWMASWPTSKVTGGPNGQLSAPFRCNCVLPPPLTTKYLIRKWQFSHTSSVHGSVVVDNIRNRPSWNAVVAVLNTWRSSIFSAPFLVYEELRTL